MADVASDLAPEQRICEEAEAEEAAMPIYYYRGSGGGRRRRTDGMLFMLALHVASQFLQLQRKPPVTAALIVANVLVYLRPGILNELLPSLHDACLNPHIVLRDMDIKRVFLSAFFHVDESHLVYNMLSLMWKGVQLEGSMGSKKFASMVAVLLALSHGLVVLVAKLWSALSDSPDPVFSECAVGFSAVLFALKVVLNHNSPSYTNVYGILVPARYAAWAELLLIQMFVPGTSFLGHLCGILAGLIYVYRRQLFPPSTPFLSLFGRLVHVSWLMISWPFKSVFGPLLGLRRRIYGRGVVGSASVSRRNMEERQGSGNDLWRCSACTFDNVGYLDVCEMCGTRRPSAVEQGLRSSAEDVPSAPQWPEQEDSTAELTLEELRQARLARFSR